MARQGGAVFSQSILPATIVDTLGAGFAAEVCGWTATEAKRLKVFCFFFSKKNTVTY